MIKLLKRAKLTRLHFFSRMNQARRYAAGAHHNSLGFLVSGGSHSGSDRSGSAGLSSSELSTEGATWGAYTPLPIELIAHCMVALDGNDGDFFLAGGFDGSRQDLVFIHRSNNWVEVPQMPTVRNRKKSNKEAHVEIIQIGCFFAL